MSAKPWPRYIAATVRSWRSRLPGMRIGIAALLTISFVAVAVLAVAANLIVERGLSLVETLEQRSAFTPAPARPITFVTTTQELDPHTKLLGDAVAPAVDGYERAVHDRVDAPVPANAAELAKSSAALDHALAELSKASAVTAATQRKLSAHRHQLAGASEELIALTDARSAMYADYRTCLEQMQARTRSAIDHAWKIFGRVFARRSLIALDSAIEALSQRATLVLDKEMDGDGSIEQAETRLRDALDNSDLKSQGESWLESMHADMDQLVRLRSSSQSLDERRQSVAKEFAATAADLKAIARSISRSAMTAATTTVTHTISPDVNDTRAQPPSVTVSVPTRQFALPQRISAALVAWISGSVLLLLIVISLAAVWSIVVPVRRMLHATAQLSKGDLSARLKPGGIKELHGLALAFNEMAEQLQTAQQASTSYQQQLEARVEERTQQLRELALNDPLTSLPNRRQLFAILEAALDDARRQVHRVGVFFLDIDNFKNINDSMGHSFGDKLLQAMARRLQEAVGDFAFAARLGGDEFTIVYPKVSNIQNVETAGWALVRAFERPLVIDGRDLAVSVSVGASVYPIHGEDPNALLQAADAALFHAKGAGRRQLALFSPELFERAAKKFATEQGLRRALERNEFELLFQPELDTRTFKVSLVEALLRWRQPDGRLAPPSEFLAVAEECGLISELNDWVLRAAIETAARWHHGAWPKARVAVNVSSRQLIDSNFVDRIAMLLREYRVPAGIIEIELTESVLQTGHGTLDALKQLRALGVTIALDDFGAGYSSLASLQQLPLTRIKLDRSLIESIDTSPRSLAIARTIISLCRSLGLELTAEGIERPEQLALLCAEGHLYAQGYYLARPLQKNDLLPALEELPRRFNRQDIEDTSVLVSRLRG